MFITGPRKNGWLLSAFLLSCSLLSAQERDPAAKLKVTGEILVAGHSTPYLIRHLPVSSFPGLPEELAAQLNSRGCLIPQTYQAHHPENVVHASLERRGSADWAVLCSVDGTVSLLVFLSSRDGEPAVLASVPETSRLQAHGASNVLGFNWGIDPVSPQQVHEAQLGMRHPPARLDHDALADSIVDRKTVYRFYSKDAWTEIDTQD